MGDRCSVTVKIPHTQIMTVEYILGILTNYLGECYFDNTPDGQDQFISVQWDEINYGAGSFFAELPNKHPSLKLEVINDAGDSYGAGSILLTGNPQRPKIEVDLDLESYNPTIQVRGDGSICAKQLEAALAYHTYCKELFPENLEGAKNV